MVTTESIPFERGGRKVTNSFYPHVYIVSDAALTEKCQNWHEYGYGEGGATVAHPDWYETMRQEEERAEYPGHVCVSSADGLKGFAGCIRRRYDGLIELNG